MYILNSQKKARAREAVHEEAGAANMPDKVEHFYRIVYRTINGPRGGTQRHRKPSVCAKQARR